jgi:hypothetical protein
VTAQGLSRCEDFKMNPAPFRSRHGLRAEWYLNHWIVDCGVFIGTVMLLPGDTLTLNADTKLAVRVQALPDGSLVESFLGLTP